MLSPQVAGALVDEGGALWLDRTAAADREGAAVRTLASAHPYDEPGGDESTVSLRGDRDEVTAAQREWQRLGLDGRRLLKAMSIYST